MNYFFVMENELGKPVPNNWTAINLYNWMLFLSVIDHRPIIQIFPGTAIKFQLISGTDFKFQ